MTELDELLRPTVADAPKRRLPWRVSSQFWVAFFGGIPAVTGIAFLNARRLGSSARRQQWILVAGLVAMAAFLALFAWLRETDDGARTLRLVARVLAVVLFLVLARIQREDDGRHQVFGSGQYAPLWIPGILAAVISGLLLLGLATVTVRLLS
ncbi:MAG TPA: hypothetical protein VFP80_15520 [Thermoanaerobaculia bacterium]|nr:hypothetical protein [Thermoanaerobaculia bacterium]